MKTKYVIALSLIALAVVLRVLPHAANFAPMGAVAIFAGAVLPRKIALWVPLVAIITSDAIIGFYSMMPVTWACFVLVALASSTWLKKPTFLKGAVVTVSSSLFFFGVTNFAVWVQSGMYAHTWRGLVECFTMALPFFRNTAASDIVYTTALFSVFGLANIIIARRHPYGTAGEA
jgi:hypothetical protein